MSRSNNEFYTGIAKREKTGDSYERGNTEYLTGTGENAVGTQSGAYVSIKHPFTSYEMPGDYEHYDYDKGDTDNEISARNWARVNNVGEGEQLPLFKVDHKPPVLDVMFATKDNTQQGAALAAHAVEETRRRFGERPLASSDTSTYSTKFVNNAIKHKLIKGVEGQPEGEYATEGNSLNFKDSHDAIQSRARRFQDGMDDSSWGNEAYSPVNAQTVQLDKTNLATEALHNIRNEKTAAKVEGRKTAFDGESLKQLEFDF